MTNILVDEPCQRIAEYLRDGLNRAYEVYQQRTPEFDQTPRLIVRHITTMNEGLDLSCFPALKVYTLRTIYKPGTTIGVSPSVVEYCLAYPDIQDLPGLIKWVSDQINRLLRDYQTFHNPQCEPQIGRDSFIGERRIQINENRQALYPFLRFNFTFTDHPDD